MARRAARLADGGQWRRRAARADRARGLRARGRDPHAEARLRALRHRGAPVRGHAGGDPAPRVRHRSRRHARATTIIRRGPLDQFLEKLGDDGPLVILDEAYRDFSDDPETPDGVALARRWPRLIALRTFSKIAALAGLRVGYVVGAPEIMGWLNRVRAPFNVNRFAQVAAVAALEDRAHLERTRALVLSERPRLLAELARRGCPAPPSQANFLLPRIGAQSRELAAALLKAGILVRDGGAVGFPEHLRIAIGRPEDNARLLEVLDETLAAP
ncbi:MAG: hypothetical protein DME10_01255 [Candidatus Rokuibacteriota bacterium]|nr:MAG: hypothetical protein DME10_01255 [Candidatus Rokubacteria bacterium]